MKAIEKISADEAAPLYEQVHRRLCAALMSGRFRPGERITLNGIAEMLGVGMMPVRGAVLQLVTSRALEMPTSRSLRIPPFSASRFFEVHNLRVLLEGEAAAQAASVASDKSLAMIEKIHAQLMKKARSARFSAMLELNREFHFAIYAASGNEVRLDIIEHLWLKNGPYLALILDSEARTNNSYFAHHDTIMQGLRERRPDLARSGIVSDIEDGLHFYESWLNPG